MPQLQPSILKCTCRPSNSPINKISTSSDMSCESGRTCDQFDEAISFYCRGRQSNHLGTQNTLGRPAGELRTPNNRLADKVQDRHSNQRALFGTNSCLYVVACTVLRQGPDSVKAGLHLCLFDVSTAGAILRRRAECQDLVVVGRPVVNITERMPGNNSQEERREQTILPSPSVSRHFHRTSYELRRYKIV